MKNYHFHKYLPLVSDVVLEATRGSFLLPQPHLVLDVCCSNLHRNETVMINYFRAHIELSHYI